MRLILQKTIQNILVSVAGFLVFIILSFDTLAAGRTLSREDSLHKALGTTVDANSKVWLYISLAELLKDRSPDSSIKYLDEARQIFWQINAMPYLGKVFEIKGEISRNQNKSKEAIRQYGIAAFCYQRQGKLQNQMEILNQIGNLYAHSDDIAEAFNSYIKVREIAEEIKDTDMQARVNSNIGRLYVVADDYQTGIEYYKKTLAVFKGRNDSLKTAKAYMNLSMAYNYLREFDSAKICAENATAIYHAKKQMFYLAISYIPFTHSLIAQERYNEALDYLQMASNIHQELGSGITANESNLLLSDVIYLSGMAYYLKGDYFLAKKYLLQGYRHSISLGLLVKARDETEYLSLTFEKTGQMDSSFFFYKHFKRYSDSLNNLQSINVVNLREKQMEYEADVKEKKSQLLYAKSIKNRNLAISIAIFIALTSLIVILFLRLRIKNQKELQHQIEKKQALIEKEAAEQLLEAQNKELVTKVLQSTRTSEMILRIAEKLKELDVNDDSFNGKIKRELFAELLSSSNKDDSWKEFEMRFHNVHTKFYSNLRERFPDLTNNEIRLSSLLRLNMTTKEISAITHQTERAIVLSRHRLRQKFELQSSDNLVVFLSQF